MVSLTLAIPSEMKTEMERFPEMNWSGFVRQCIEKKTNELSWKKKMLSKLNSSEEIDLMNWSLDLQAKSRKGRVEELKRQGFLK
jgi:hypothetical protein